MKIGFLSLLTLIFITLKLLGAITWSWIWVLAPLWIIPAIAVGSVILVLIAAYSMGFIDWLKYKFK